MPDRVGQQIGNYRLVRLLGSGGFAEVYLGQHVHIHKQAAIKLLHAQLARKYQTGFMQEAETIESLRHPHIIRILDFGIESNAPYLIMDYASNGTLRNRHPKGSIVAPGTVVSYVKQIAEALQYAHNHNLIHRDLKPENILIGENGEILLSDFGIAAIVHGTASIETGVYMGTIQYSAPEQIQGKPRRESDQYSLGIIVYEWLSGNHPFNGTLLEIISQHLGVMPPPLRGKLPGIPPAVEQVIMTALAKDPKQRFGNVQAFAAAFEQACTLPSNQVPPIVEPILNQSTQAGMSTIQVTPQEEVISQQLEPSVPAAGPVSRKTARTLSAAQQSQQTQQSQQRGTVSFHTTPVTPSTRANVPPEAVVASRRFTRRKVLELGFAGAGVIATGLVGWWEVSHRSPANSAIPTGTTLYTYRGHSYAVNAVAWSPDGQYIASGADDDTVQVWNASSGQTSLTYHYRLNIVLSVAWSPNSKYLASSVWFASDSVRQVCFMVQKERGQFMVKNRRLVHLGGKTVYMAELKQLLTTCLAAPAALNWISSE